MPLARPVRLRRAGRGRQGVVVRGLHGRVGAPGAVLHAGARATRSWASSRADRASACTASDCPNAKALQREPERLIEVTGRRASPPRSSWRSRWRRSTGPGSSPTSRPCCRDTHVNILSATSATGRDRITRLRFTFELADIAHLSSVLASVKRVDGVFDAYRVVPELSMRVVLQRVARASVSVDGERRRRSGRAPAARRASGRTTPRTSPSGWPRRSRTCGSSPTTQGR